MEWTEENLNHCLSLANVPESLWNGLTQYILHGRPIGHFLTAIISNDLKDACGRADLDNRYRLYDIVYFLHNYAPAGCWGNEDNVTKWSNHRGMEFTATSEVI